MSERRAATTIGELDIHLCNMQVAQSDLAREFREALKIMATKTDIENIRSDMSKLATRAELDAEIKALQDRFQNSTPASVFYGFVKFCGGAAVIASFVMLLLNVAKWVQ